MAVKKFGLGLLGLVILLVAAVLIAPSFVDWNAYKDRIATEVRKATGRELTIAGDIALSLLPAPALSVDKVSLANAVGGSDPIMVALESLKVRIAVLPLLRGRLQVNSVELVKPTILIEKLADGSGNWIFASTAEQPSATSPSSGPATSGPTTSDDAAGFASQITLESVSISDGTLVYRDAADGREERVTSLNAEIAADSLQGPVAAKGQATVRALVTDFDISIGRLLAEGATPVAVALRLPEPAARLQFSGAVSLHADGTSLRGRVKASGDDLAAAIGAFQDAGAAPAILAKPFTLDTDLSVAPDRISADAVSFRQGELALDGAVQVTLGTPLDVRVNLSAALIDVDKILAESAATTGSGAPPPAASAPSAAPIEAAAGDAGFALPTDVTGSLHLSVDALMVRGQIVRQVLVSADLSAGQIRLGQGIALLPGGSDVSLTGTLAAEPETNQPRFTGRVEAASDNLRAVFEWLGVETTAVPAERLRRMTLSGSVEATPQRLTLNEIDLRVDVSRATGGIAVALRERPGFGIGLVIDKINLDAYLPPAPAGAGGQAAAPSAAGGAPAPATESPGPAALEAIDANLDVRLGSLSARGVSARDLHLDVTLQGGALVVREALIGDLGGGSARVTGAVAGLATAPTFDGAVDVKVPDPARLAKALNVEAAALSRLGAFDLAGTLKGSTRALDFDMKLNAVGGSLALAGTAQPTATPLSFDVAVTAQHPSLAKLAGAVTDGLRLEPGLGGLNLSARVAGTAQRFTASALTGKIGPSEVSGSLGADLSGSKPALTVDLTTGVLPVAGLLAPAAAGSGQSGTGGTGAAAAPAAGERWSRQPIDVSALNAIDADVKLRAQALVADKMRLDGAVIEATLADGLLDVRKLTGTFYDGALSVTGKVATRGNLQVGLAVTAIEMNLGRLLQDLAESDRVSGPLTVNASLTSEGGSEAELISALGGRGDLSGTLTVKRKAEEQVGALVLGILGEKIKEIRGVTDATNVLFGAFAGAPSALNGTFTVERGVLTTKDTRLDGRQATALTQGTVELPAWLINTRTDLFRAEDPKTPYLTAELRGPLDKPNPRISGQAFKSQQTPPPAAPGTPPAAQSAPSAPAPLKPEDVLKQGLKGLLKGLNN